MARKQTLDTALLFGVLGMLLLGITMVASATLFMADKDFHDSLFFIKRHASHLVFGLGGFFLGFCVKPRALVGLRVVFLVATLCLLTLVYLPGVGVMVNGARRWVALPFMSLQPSELAKWSFIVYVAAYCAKRSKQEDRLRLVDAVAIFSLTFICDCM